MTEWGLVAGFGAAALVGFALAAVVWGAGRASEAGRVLTGLLAAESGLLAANTYLVVRSEQTLDGLIVLAGLIFAGFYAIASLYLRVVATLDTPLARPVRTPAARRLSLALPVVGYGGVLVIVPLAALGVFTVPAGDEPPPVPLLVWVGIGFVAIIAASLYGLVAAASAFRRAPLGTAQRGRARAYLIAFATRDIMYILVLIGSEVLAEMLPGGKAALGLIDETFFIVATLAYFALLAYGLLQTQLFDIDLKIKMGIRRSTAVTLGLVAVLAAAKVAEFYLNTTFGFVAGGVAAGVMLFLAPRLNRIGDKVANAAMPNVQPTPAYVAFKKLEVYRAAVEASVETGGIDDRERLKLDRLREKLGIGAEDARAVESDALAPAPVSGGA